MTKLKPRKVFLNSPDLPIELSGSPVAMMNMARALLEAGSTVTLTTFTMLDEASK